jgi:hypothetical protein
MKLVTVGQAFPLVLAPPTKAAPPHNFGRGEPVPYDNAKTNRVPTVGDAVLVWSARKGAFWGVHNVHTFAVGLGVCRPDWRGFCMFPREPSDCKGGMQFESHLGHA